MITSPILITGMRFFSCLSSRQRIGYLQARARFPNQPISYLAMAKQFFGWCASASCEPRCDVSALHCPLPFPPFLQPFVSHFSLVILNAGASRPVSGASLFKPCEMKFPLYCLAALYPESLGRYPFPVRFFISLSGFHYSSACPAGYK